MRENSVEILERDGRSDRLFSFHPNYLLEGITFEKDASVYLLPIFGERTGLGTWKGGYLGNYGFIIKVFGIFGLILLRICGKAGSF